LLDQKLVKIVVFLVKKKEASPLLTIYLKCLQDNAFLRQHLADVAGWLWSKPQAGPDIS
jgi:hypothetical protein